MARSGRKRRWRRRLIVLAALLVVGAVGAYLLVLLLLPSAVIYAPNNGEAIDPADDRSGERLAALGVTRALRVAVPSPPASLALWVIDPPGHSPPWSTVFALHGVRDSKWSLLGFGKALAGRGHRAVLVDLRGQGRSSGDWLTFGVVESKDLKLVLDRLQGRGLVNGPVGVVGFSYGGAVALQWAARDPRVRAVATVATFTTLHDVVPLYVRRNVPLLGRLVTRAQIDSALERAGTTAGFDPRQASPLRAIGATRAPVLLVHGADDHHIPADHARALRRAADHTRSKLLVIPGADHVTVFGHPRMKQAVLGWMTRWLHHETAGR